jgi:hypothetical protein
MAIEKGSSYEVFVSASTAAAPSPPTGRVNRIRDVSFPRSLTKENLTDNDSGVAANHGVIRVTGNLTFKMRLDRALAGQGVLLNANNLQAGGADNDGFVNVVARPAGSGTGRPQLAFRASVDISPAHMVDNFAEVDVTLEPDGPVVQTTQ